MSRFVDIDLSRLPPVDVIRPLDFEADYAARMNNLKARLEEVGIPFEVEKLHANPLARRERSAAYFDLLLKARVNDAARSVRLAYATGSDLDHIAAEFGVLRQDGETDASLRRRRQLVLEAFSTAGPEGAYLFFALAAHPHVADAAIYDPHSGHCEPGQVLVVIASSDGQGVPRPAVLNSVADFLDARTVRYADLTSWTRPITRKQQFRPLNDWVIVEAATDHPFSVDAVLKVPYGPDTSILRETARDRLQAYLTSRRRVGAKISDSSVSAALHVTDPSGVALVEDIDLTFRVNGLAFAGDIDPGPKGIARATAINLDIEVLT